jgi:hypothetical protein
MKFTVFVTHGAGMKDLGPEEKSITKARKEESTKRGGLFILLGLKNRATHLIHR